MKKIHLYMIRQFILPFLATFFVVLFVLLMQFVWKYVDDMVGKGLEWLVIGELLFYTSASMVPLALPLAMLLSSLMLFGNLGEQYELVAMKSSGLSLGRIMKPLVVVAVLISVSAFYFSNDILPIANLKAGSLLWDIRQQKPALNIKEGIFYNGIEGYSIRIMNIDKDGKKIGDVMIYDHISRQGNNKVIIAKDGRMEVTPDKRYILITLYNGYSYEEIAAYREAEHKYSHPLRRIRFAEQTVRMDLSSFIMTRTDEELFKEHEQMLSVKQLEAAEDTILRTLAVRHDEMTSLISERYFFYRMKSGLAGFDSTTSAQSINQSISQSTNQLFTDSLSDIDQAAIIETALNQARGNKLFATSFKDEVGRRVQLLTVHRIEWHRKFTLSIACMLLFFIGAPLGAIIRIGGFGMPVVVSICFFLFFHVLSITFEKLVREGEVVPFIGLWVASAILLPLGIFLTWKATTDSAIFDIHQYTKLFKRVFRFKFLSNNENTSGI